MRFSLCVLMGWMVFASSAAAEVAPVAVRLPEAKAWIGQRVPFFVELRSPGSFSGSASFDLPQLPGTLLMKIGNPVVGSQKLEGATWFVQTHEFALFSQKPGSLEVPAFTVRFAQRDGFTGPASDIKAESPGFKVEIQHPPGSENMGFLITTESFEVTEMWDPEPGPAEVGSIFKRTIVQRASHVPGMALAAAPTSVPDGFRIYPESPETNDKLERGDFQGERRETITYLIRKSGTLELPALNYVWWNPTTKTLESKTLATVPFEVAPPPAAKPTKAFATRRAWLWLLGGALLLGISALKWRSLAEWGRHVWNALNPRDRIAARKLRRACRRNDPAAAVNAWNVWQTMHAVSFKPATELRTAITELQLHLFGPSPTDPWRGGKLLRAFDQHLTSTNALFSDEDAPALPLLNPQSLRP